MDRSLGRKKGNRGEISGQCIYIVFLLISKPQSNFKIELLSHFHKDFNFISIYIVLGYKEHCDRLVFTSRSGNPLYHDEDFCQQQVEMSKSLLTLRQIVIFLQCPTTIIYEQFDNTQLRNDFIRIMCHTARTEMVPHSIGVFIARPVLDQKTMSMPACLRKMNNAWI